MPAGVKERRGVVMSDLSSGSQITTPLLALPRVFSITAFVLAIGL
jgi:hypothetical protein